jgi:hypothetical protein
MVIRPLLKDVTKENDLHNKTNNFIKDMKFNVAKSCFSCKHIRKYKVKTGVLEQILYGCSIVFDKSGGEIITQPNCLCYCSLYKKMDVYAHKRDIRQGAGFPTHRTPEITVTSDGEETEVVTFKEERSADILDFQGYITDNIPFGN